MRKIIDIDKHFKIDKKDMMWKLDQNKQLKLMNANIKPNFSTMYKTMNKDCIILTIFL